MKKFNFLRKEVSKLVSKEEINHKFLLTNLPTNLLTRKRCAFTLAEVLITLGIIGIVAAITMPTLISNYRKDKTINQLKQAYSQFQQATQMAISDSGLEPEYWLSGAELSLSTADKREIIYERYIKPYMNTSNFNKSKGTFYDSKGVKYTLSPNYYGLLWDMSHNHIAQLAVDLDGDKGKNADGVDKFYFMYKRSGVQFFISQEGQTYGFLPCGQSNINRYFSDAHYGAGTSPACNTTKTGGSARACCGDVIMRQGWKITEDYPDLF